VSQLLHSISEELRNDSSGRMPATTRKEGEGEGEQKSVLILIAVVCHDSFQRTKQITSPTSIENRFDVILCTCDLLLIGTRLLLRSSAESRLIKTTPRRSAYSSASLTNYNYVVYSEKGAHMRYTDQATDKYSAVPYQTIHEYCYIVLCHFWVSLYGHFGNLCGTMCALDAPCHMPSQVLAPYNHRPQNKTSITAQE